MMTIGGTAHILMLVATLLIIVILMFIVAKSKKIVQDIIITFFIALGTFGIFFLHGLHRGTQFDILNLLRQMLQVCNFNFILLPICLFKKNEICRQYLFFFSMPAALSTFVAYPSDVQQAMWYDIVCLNFWIDHACIVIVPLLMIASKRFKPEQKYVKIILICVVAYFLMAFVGDWALNEFSFENIHYNYSYTMNDGGIMVLKPIYKLIPIPFVYLLPLAVPLYFIFWLEAYCFKNYQTTDRFGYELKKKEGGR